MTLSLFSKETWQTDIPGCIDMNLQVTMTLLSSSRSRGKHLWLCFHFLNFLSSLLKYGDDTDFTHIDKHVKSGGPHYWAKNHSPHAYPVNTSAATNVNT